VSDPSFHTFNYLAHASSAEHAILTVTKIMAMPSVMRSIILRDHRELGVYKSSEIDFRHDVDHFLHFIGILELATQAQFFDPAEMDWSSESEATATTLAALSDDSFIRYFSDIYPEELPRLFCTRLGVESLKNRTKLPSRTGSQRLFFRILEIDRSFVCDPDLDLFLKLLDDFTVSQFRFSDLAEILSKPSDVTDVLDSDNFSIAADSLIGMEKFFIFCEALEATLRAAADFPSFQVSAYGLYRYWFSESGSNSRAKLTGAFDSIASWDLTERDFANQRQARISKAAGSLEFLWDGQNFQRDR